MATGPVPSPTYYLSFRADIAGTYEADLGLPLGGQLGPSYSRVLQVHSAEPEPGRSFLHAVLRAPGDSFALPESGVVVTLEAVDAAALSARVALVSGPQCGNGLVEGPTEECDGGACCDESCRFRSASFVCRAAAGPCDLPETCSGAGSVCAANAFAPIGTPCREASFGPCDVPDACEAGGLCPNSYAADGAACALPGCPAALSGQCLSRQCLGTCSDSSTSSSSSSSSSFSSAFSSSSSSAPTPSPGTAVCGDGVCGAGEDCKSCAADCAHGPRYCCGYFGCLGRGCPATAEAVASLCKIAPPANLLCLLGQCQ